MQSHSGRLQNCNVENSLFINTRMPGTFVFCKFYPKYRISYINFCFTFEYGMCLCVVNMCHDGNSDGIHDQCTWT